MSFSVRSGPAAPSRSTTTVSALRGAEHDVGERHLLALAVQIDKRVISGLSDRRIFFRDSAGLRGVGRTSSGRQVDHRATPRHGGREALRGLYGSDFDGPWDDLVIAVRATAAETIDRDGAFIVEGDVGAFICS
jgi:hypothetical protein